MKRILTLLFVMLLSALALTSCADAEDGEFNIYSLDVFGIFTPDVLREDPEEVFDKAIDDITDAKEYELNITSYVDYKIVGILEGIQEREIPRDSNDTLTIRENENGLHIFGETVYDAGLGAIRSEQMSLHYFDGFMYTDYSGTKYKVEVPKERLETTNANVYTIMSKLIELLFKSYKPAGDDFDGVKAVKVDDLYLMEMTFIIDENIDETIYFKEGELTIKAYFDADGNLKKYFVGVEAEHGGVHLSGAYEIECRIGSVRISAPDNADEYQLRTVK